MPIGRQCIDNFLACLVFKGDKLSNILIVNHYSITSYFKRTILSFLKNDGTYDDLMLLPLIILIPIFSKTITKIRGFLRVAFLSKTAEFY